MQNLALHVSVLDYNTLNFNTDLCENNHQVLGTFRMLKHSVAIKLVNATFFFLSKGHSYTAFL